MSFTNDLLTGLAADLAGNVTGLTWSPTGVYAAGQTGITVMAVPQSPDRLVTLTPYPTGDDPTLSDSNLGLQVRSRSAAADPRDVFDLDDSIADYLLGNYPVDLPTGIHITTLVRSSAVSLGQDGSKRWEWASNYALQVHRPSVHRV